MHGADPRMSRRLPGEPLAIHVTASARTPLRGRWARRVEVPLDTSPADPGELRRLIAQYLELPAADIEITPGRLHRRRRLTVRIRH